MPKKYAYKCRGKTQLYTDEDLEKAVNAVKDGMSIRKSSEAYNVPRSTIGDRISGKHALHVRNGRPPHIPVDLENKIVESIKMAARRGIGLSRGQILAKTNVLCHKMQITGYKNFVAGKDWWEGLKRRHPDIALKKPERLSSTRARMMNPEVLKRYFNDLGTIIEGLHLQDKPGQIWNCDEMSKNFEHAPVRVAAAKGTSCVSRTSSKSTNITVMACVSATGLRMPPMFIVKGKTSRSVHGFNTEAAPPESTWFYQKNGWMSDEIGETWFRQVFLNHCGPARPQLLILDGHSSHESLSILMCAIEENVHLLALPPHTTHQLQPLDRTVFGPVNKAYNKTCSEFLQDNPLHQINKWSFPALFTTAWNAAVTPNNIESGFRACGIYPFNPDVIPAAAFGPSQPTDRPKPSANDDVSTGSSDNVETPLPMEGAMQDGISSESFVPPTNDDIEIIPIDAGNSSMNVLDISDPQQLIELLASGDITIEPLVGSNSEFIFPPQDPIEQIFMPTQPTPARKPKSKAITTHRLLTSNDIVQEKIKSEEKKMEKKVKKEKKTK